MIRSSGGSVTPATVDAVARGVTRFPRLVERLGTPGPTLRDVLAHTVPYTGHTTEGRRVVVDVRRGAVVHVRVGVRHYRCETFGDIGPVVVARAGRAQIGASGRFVFRAGRDVERLTVSGVLRGRRVRGTVRLTGTIATGERCRSARLRFVAER